MQWNKTSPLSLINIGKSRSYLSARDINNIHQWRRLLLLFFHVENLSQFWVRVENGDFGFTWNRNPSFCVALYWALFSRHLPLRLSVSLVHTWPWRLNLGFSPSNKTSRPTSLRFQLETRIPIALDFNLYLNLYKHKIFLEDFYIFGWPYWQGGITKLHNHFR